MSEDEAMRATNEPQFGLGAGIWTQDPSKVKWLVRDVESGTIFVNALVKSDPRMPFGGIKRSGIGRELTKYGLTKEGDSST